MKNTNADQPAFLCSKVQQGEEQCYGLTKREYFAAQIAGHLITREKYPASFLDFLKHQFNKLGYNFEVNYRMDIDARCTAQQAAIHADTLLDQLNHNRLDNVVSPEGNKLVKCAESKMRAYRSDGSKRHELPKE